MTKTKQNSTKPKGEAEALRILGQARREPRFRAQRERDALIRAIEYGDVHVAHSLLAHGVDPNSTQPKGRSALWYAAHWGRSGLIRDLARRGARLPDDVLMGPVHDGDAELVRFLIRRGANVNCVATFTRYSHKFPQKEVLLTEAIRKILLFGVVDEAARKMRVAMKKAAAPAGPSRRVIEAIPIMLIRAGANVNRLAFEYAIYEGYIRTILGLAAFNGLTRTVKAMLAAGADVNQRDTWGGTALLDAAFEDRREVARILLAAGAKKNLRRRDGATPVSIARERGHADLADEIENYRTRR